MGYWISKLKSIPRTFNWYLFLVGDSRNHSIINNFLGMIFVSFPKGLGRLCNYRAK